MNSVKKNKTSFDEKIHSLKLDVTKRRLVWLLIPVAIILVGIILVSTIGFNLGIDFTGGTIINVIPNEINISDENNYNQVKVDIEEVLNEFGLKSTQFQIVENDQGTAVSVRFQDRAGADEKEMNTLINDKVIPALYEKFGMDTFDIIENSHERLTEIRGITGSKAQTIYEEYFLKRNMQDVVMKLQEYDISPNVATKIYEKYKDSLLNV